MHGLPSSYYMVAKLLGEVYGVKLDGTGFVGGNIRVTRVVPAEVHVDESVEPV